MYLFLYLNRDKGYDGGNAECTALSSYSRVGFIDNYILAILVGCNLMRAYVEKNVNVGLLCH